MIKGVNQRETLVEEFLREYGVGFRSDWMMQAAETVENRLMRRVDRGLQITAVGAARNGKRKTEHHGRSREQNTLIHRDSNLEGRPLPNQRQQVIPDFALIVRVTREVACQELLLIKQPPHEHQRHRNEREQSPQ